MYNLHLILNNFQHASRVLKETNSLVQSGLVKQVYVAALYDDGLEVDEQFGSQIVAHRFDLRTRHLSKHALIQLIKYLELGYKVVRFYRRKNIGMVNVHGLTLLPLGVLLKYVLKAQLVYDTHELETERNGLSGYRQEVSKWVERRLLRYVDMTLVVSENIADWYADTYDMPRPTVVMNAPKHKPVSHSDVFRETFAIRQDQAIFLYQGGLMTGRGVPLLLEAFERRDSDDAVIVFMGYGPLEGSVKAAASRLKTIFFQPAVPPDVVLDYTSAADVGLSVIENTCLSYFYCMPNKLFEYAMAGLPVVVSDMKEMREFVNRYEFGFVVSEQSVAGIDRIVDQVLATDLDPFKENALVAAADNSWAHQERKMLAAYEQLWAKA